MAAGCLPVRGKGSAMLFISKGRSQPASSQGIRRGACSGVSNETRHCGGPVSGAGRCRGGSNRSKRPHPSQNPGVARMPEDAGRARSSRWRCQRGWRSGIRATVAASRRGFSFLSPRSVAPGRRLSQRAKSGRQRPRIVWNRPPRRARREGRHHIKPAMCECKRLDGKSPTRVVTSRR
jgi:hypothetical protein